MNSRVKKLWTDALRSGEFVQGKGQLLRNDKWCCLGVLCELFRRDTCKGEWVEISAGHEFVVTRTSGATSAFVLPYPVQDWAGLTAELPDTPEGNLSCLNDTSIPFPKIADVIDKYY